MLAAVGQQGEDFDGPVLDRRGQVLHWHRRKRRLPQASAQVRARAGPVADLHPGHGRDPDNTTLDPGRPLSRVGASREADERGLVDQPGRHCQARDITFGSVRSLNTSANRARSRRRQLGDFGTLPSKQASGSPARIRTTVCYDRARKNLDHHPNYILAAYMASGI